MSEPGKAITLEQAADSHWDVIVVGTGMGGATFGFAMARAGRSVLFCERGQALGTAPDALTGAYPEECGDGGKALNNAAAIELFRRGGRDVDPIYDRSTASVHRFTPYVGSGAGGSSALYGMAMERFFPSDYEPGRQHPNASGSTMPARWPVDYADMATWYRAAEALYRVRGTLDPLRPADDAAFRPGAPPPLTPESSWLRQHLESRGLNPYRLPMACDFAPGCQGCQGYLCPQACKNDSARTCLWPAISDHGAHLVANCHVTHLESSATAVTGVVCTDRQGNSHRLAADIFVLAAGALRTPAVLLRSATPDWPDGLANGSGMVGRNLMRHCIDLFAIKFPRELRSGSDIRQKQLAFSDFYHHPDGKLGSVQSFGRLPPSKMMLAALEDDVLRSPFRRAAPLVRLARPLLRRVLDDLEHNHLVLAATLEDAPYADNRVTLTTGADRTAAVDISYRLRPYEVARMAEFGRAISQRLKPLRIRHIAQASNNERIAHACGTCRFGESPRDSVLDANNRAHGVGNLYVVDASFFPSSGGTNPGLTIAANALRVANALLARGQ